MKKQPICNFILAGMSLTEFGLEIPSPFCSLTLTNSEITSFTTWKLVCTVGGDSTKRVNSAAFEGLLYSAAQEAAAYKNSSGIPVSFMFGWLGDNGMIAEHASYQGFTLKFSVSTTGRFLTYTIQGYASLAVQSSMPVLRIPALSGIVQPSAIVEGLAKSVKATNYYELDIDHNDTPTLVSHGAMTTSFNSYVRGTYSTEDDYKTFPGLLKLSKSYNSNRDAAGLNKTSSVKTLNQVMNNRKCSSVSSFLKKGLTDNTPQSSSFSYWIDEPTQTQPGVIHYKSDANLLSSNFNDALEYGTANTNILSLTGSYNGVAYNMTDMKFSQIGFTLDGSGNEIVEDAQVVNSWSASVGDVFQTANIVNDINAIASQFSGDFQIIIPGTTRKYEIAQPVSLIVMSGNTLSPITGIYSVMSVSHSISNTFTTTLKIQRLVIGSANQVASAQGILVSGSSIGLPSNSFNTTANIISPYKVDFGELYPDFTYMLMM